MKISLLSILFFGMTMPFAQAQFAPQAGVSGSTAIHKSSSLIKAWGTECTIRRGFQDIANTSLGYTNLGDSSNALGAADAEVVSLGDSGIATVRFNQHLYNGTGADFAVFENGFQNPANAEEAFLELAFVEVSSDGEHFFRFPASSNTNTTTQIRGAGDYMNARLLNNLAGKYVAQYGTPFDLDELKSVAGLDVNHIVAIRIIDVVGAINGHSSRDALGQVINDPYPTAFPSGGFDLDAVAALNISGTSIDENKKAIAQIFPNPAAEKLFVTLNEIGNSGDKLVLCDLSGRILIEQKAALENELSLTDLQSGFYLLGISTINGIQWIGRCAKI